MPHDEGRIIQAKASRTLELTDNSTPLLSGFPDQFQGTAAAVLAGI